MPEYFNIRRAERGILTKNTKRTGGNLHCIMVFKKLQDSLTSGLFDIIDIEDDMSSQSEVEELDSSDSDLPTSGSSEGLDCDKDKSYTDGVREGDSGDQRHILSPFERDPFTKFAPALHVHHRTYSSDSDYSAEVESEHDQDDSKDDWSATVASGVRRSGTFTKERPTLSVQQNRPLSSDMDSDCSMDAADSANLEGGRIKRSNTFTKETSDLAEEYAVVVPTGDEDFSYAPGVTRITKERPSGDADQCHSTDLQSIDLDDTLKASDFI